MYEELYQPLPDIQAYLERIHVEPSDNRDLAYLNKLILGHQMNIPFENLDVMDYHIPSDLSIGALFHRQVIRKHGGYCFEMNALFNQALLDLGYEAWSVMVRGVRNKTYFSPIMHRGVVTMLDGVPYYCDVGFGGPAPNGAVRMEDGAVTVTKGVGFRFVRLDAWWWELQRENKEGVFEKLFHIQAMPQRAVDFVVLNEYCSTSPKSGFTQARFLNITTETGSVGVHGDELTIVDGDKKETRTITEDEFWEVAAKYYGITDRP